MTAATPVLRPAFRSAALAVILPALLVILLAALLWTPAAHAQENPDVARGFSAEKLYQFGELDSVNLFNGNLTLALPMGPGYTADGHLAYAFTLTYNSNIWRFEQRKWKKYQADGSYYFVTSKVAKIDPTYNAGPGWKLSLGELLDPADPDNEGMYFTYIGEDGSQHAFYDTLHNEETGVANVWYSRDGSYLRLKRYNNGLQFVVELPDGSKRSFFRASNSWSSPFRIQYVEDPFGNRLTVTEASPIHWELTDGYRTHHIHYVNRTIDGRTMRLIDRLEVAQFGGGLATYQFNYNPLTVDESCYDDDDSDSVNDVDGIMSPAQREIYVLASIDLPDTSQWRMPSYYTTCTAGSGASYSSSDNQPGVLQKLILPTQGAYEWTYQDYTFPARIAPGKAGVGTFSGIKSTGVRRKRMLNASGGCFSFGQVGCEWWYTTSQDWGIFQHTTIVTYPSGDETKFYFNTRFRPDSTTWEGWEYGLPITTSTSDGAGRFLSQEIYDGTVASGVKQRSVYMRYERDKIGQAAVLPDEWENLNRRVASRMTVYHDDGGKHRTVDHSDFDGLGHYRVRTTRSTIPGGDTRTETTVYNAGRGSYNVNTANNTVSGGYLSWSSGSPWVLGTYTEKRQSEGSATSVQQHCFDANQGVILRERILKGSSPGSNDVLRRTGRDGVGNVTLEQWYGGDVQTLGTSSDLCNLALPADRYRKDNVYEHGTLKTSRWTTSSSGHVLWTYRSEVDKSSGLPHQVTGVDDLYTDLSYDSSGRLVSEIPQPGGGARTIYSYSKASGTAKARAAITTYTNDGTTSLTLQRIDFDELGRPWRDSRHEPSAQWSSVDTVTNAMGWKHSVSERMYGWPSKSTVYKDFDPFGRPGRIEPPDDLDHRILIWYAGDREVTRTYDVCSSSAGCASSAYETSWQVTERYDKHGRLYEVREPSGAGGAMVTTTYSYDEGNRLSRAYTSYNGVYQNRYFTYDNRGFLTSETHPEKGSYGNGSVTYSLYDPLGNPGRKQDGGFDLRYAYDRAARLTNVDEVDAVQGWRPLKSFVYAANNSGSDRRQGKLWWADRYNYVNLNGTAFTAQIRETYVYAGNAGAVSRRDTQLWVNGAAHESFTQGFAWRALGNLNYLDYPECTNAGCTNPSPRRVQFSFHPFARHSLQKVQDLTTGAWYATDVQYHPNGLYSQISHGNGVQDHQSLEASAMARPAQIWTTNANSNWDSGTYRYDGAGNVMGIGGARYSYDGVSRLTRANTNLAQVGTGTLYTRTYNYDHFGNLSSINAISGPAGRSIPIDSWTNRLDSSAASYDASGNMTWWGSTRFEYDALGMVRERQDPGGSEYLFFYTADDERIWTYHWSGSRWTLRDLDGKVLRQYWNDPNGWAVERDHVYRDGQLLAATEGNTRYHYHLDHLGTPRLITNQYGTKQAFHVYHPYGEEASWWNQDTERMKFTGHERDFYSSGPGDDLDYHHARYYQSLWGRYLSVDPKARREAVSSPQLLNRYGYGLGNPVKMVDPDGREAVTATTVAIGAGIVATVAVVNHVYQMQTNPEYRDAAITAGEAVTDALQDAGDAVTGFLSGDQMVKTGAETTITTGVTVTAIQKNTTAPGRGAPPPTAIPGEKQKTTPTPETRDADADDPQQPPSGEELFQTGTDNPKHKLWELASEVASWLSGFHK